METRDNTNLFTPPGTYSFESPLDSNQVAGESITYSTQKCSVFEFSGINRIKEILEKPISNEIQWIRIYNIGSTQALKILDEILDVHALTLEGIANPDYRTKLKVFDKYSCISAVRCCLNGNDLVTPGVSILIFKDRVITFEENIKSPFESLKNRILEKNGKIRDLGTFYLAYCLLDVIVDEYLSTIDFKYNQTVGLENRMIAEDKVDLFQDMHTLKGDGFNLKNKIRPMREMTTSMIANGYLNEKNKLYLKDLQDHTVMALEDVESLRETVSSLFELHFSIQGRRMNEIMKVLTLIATLFIPLTFIAGVYGMNFEFMPELKWQYGYPLLLGVMIIIAMGMICFFRKKGWFK